MVKDDPDLLVVLVRELLRQGHQTDGFRVRALALRVDESLIKRQASEIWFHLGQVGAFKGDNFLLDAVVGRTLAQNGQLLDPLLLLSEDRSHNIVQRFVAEIRSLLQNAFHTLRRCELQHGIAAIVNVRSSFLGLRQLMHDKSFLATGDFLGV